MSLSLHFTFKCILFKNKKEQVVLAQSWPVLSHMIVNAVVVCFGVFFVLLWFLFGLGFFGRGTLPKLIFLVMFCLLYLIILSL